MTKIAWKYIKGKGPYAYLQESVYKGKKPDGSDIVVSKHIAYLGAKPGAVGSKVSIGS